MLLKGDADLLNNYLYIYTVKREMLVAIIFGVFENITI